MGGQKAGVSPAFLFLVLLMFPVQVLGQTSPENTWDAPPAYRQVEMDPTLVPIGKGAIFVPTMTTSLAEPVYLVYTNETLVAEARTGTSVLVEPGRYQVKVGSGTIEQMITRTVDVEEGHTSLILPDWAGLVINVIDETRTPIKESYELFYQSNLENYGLGYGVDEELGEELTTWLLKPGLYKVVKPGESFNTTRNFATLRLLPGELVRYTLVLDDENQNFIGFGILDEGTRQINIEDWKIRSEINGNFILNYFQNTESQRKEYNFTLTAQWFNQLRYITDLHNAFVRIILDEGLSFEKGESIRKYVDRIELKATYIYRFWEKVGPYLNLALDSKFFETNAYFDSPRDVYRLNTGGDTTHIYTAAESVRLSPAFFPLTLKEGVGFNWIIAKSARLNLNLRSGFGARQTFVHQSYLLNDSQTQLKPLQKSTLTGLEMLMIGDSRIARRVQFNTEFDLLLPESDTQTWVYDWDNRVRVTLSKYISLDYNLLIKKEEAIPDVQSEHQVLIRLSYVL
ncbi:MAG: hypothetical protein D6675_02190 [Gemmatimonadetes bacterium]|nr:MAG: hypothetical protein D6675_02190 [Gemmatimonadota bacterium]